MADSDAQEPQPLTATSARSNQVAYQRGYRLRQSLFRSAAKYANEFPKAEVLVLATSGTGRSQLWSFGRGLAMDSQECVNPVAKLFQETCNRVQEETYKGLYTRPHDAGSRASSSNRSQLYSNYLMQNAPHIRSLMLEAGLSHAQRSVWTVAAAVWRNLLADEQQQLGTLRAPDQQEPTHAQQQTGLREILSSRHEVWERGAVSTLCIYYIIL